MQWLRRVLGPPERSSAGGSGHGGYRPDIEGLRAVAVGLVICDHLIGLPSGGFVGVDVFFVISGFLITGLLLKERARTGRISFADFYRRRARRILPVALLVLAVTVAGSLVTFLGQRGGTTVVDAVWAALFAANWRFAAMGTDYFQTALPPSPLQHYWSLAVEEQFYVVWPWLVLAAWALASRSRRSEAGRPRRLLLTVGAVTVVAFAWSAVETSVAPAIAYFSTTARAWELSAGALLAVVLANRPEPVPRPLRLPLASAGLVLVVASAFVISPSSPFPAPWALLPVLGTVCFIVAGAGSAQHARVWPLADPVSRYVGRISYSLYLWHWPVITVLMMGVMPVASTRPEKLVTAVAAGLVTLALSVLSFHLVEDPVRRSAWLEPRARRAARPVPEAAAVARRRVRTGAVAVGAVAVLAVGAVLPRAVVRADVPAVEVAAAGGGAEADLTTDVARSLTLASWDGVAPALTDLEGSTADVFRMPGCINGRDEVDRSCVLGPADAPTSVAVVGDSIAMSWVPGIEAAVVPEGWQVRVFGKHGCGYSATLQEDKFGGPYESCREHRAWVVEQIAADPPDVVVVSESWGVRSADPGASVVEGVETTLRELAATGARVVVLGAPPFGMSVGECATRLRDPRDCVVPVPAAMHERSADYARAAEAAGVRYVETTPWFCASDACPPVVDGVVVRADEIHLTAVYAVHLAGVLKSVIAAEGSGPAATEGLAAPGGEQ